MSLNMCKFTSQWTPIGLDALLEVLNANRDGICRKGDRRPCQGSFAFNDSLILYLSQNIYMPSSRGAR